MERFAACSNSIPNLGGDSLQILRGALVATLRSTFPDGANLGVRVPRGRDLPLRAGGVEAVSDLVVEPLAALHDIERGVRATSLASDRAFESRAVALPRKRSAFDGGAVRIVNAGQPCLLRAISDERLACPRRSSP